MAVSRLCSIPDCGKAAVKRGMCNPHYRRTLRERADPCTIPECTKPQANHGMCSAHYSRWKRHGSAHTVLLAKGNAAIFLRSLLQADAVDECITWPFARNNMGYGQIKGFGFYGYVHRIVCAQVHGPAPSPAYDAAHSCGNGHMGCVNPNHLAWKTKKANQADRIAHGTMIWGSAHHCAKLTERDIPIIRSMARILPAKHIAKRYAVHETTIREIIRERTWKQVAP